ncbi:MAG: hypothetical protein ABJN51_11630, partial [Sneathiella sp.]
VSPISDLFKAIYDSAPVSNAIAGGSPNIQQFSSENLFPSIDDMPATPDPVISNPTQEPASYLNGFGYSPDVGPASPNNGAMDVADMSPASMAVGAQQAANMSLGLPGVIGLAAMAGQMGLEHSLEAEIDAINNETPFSLDVDSVSAEANAVASGNDVATGIDAAVNNPDTGGIGSSGMSEAAMQAQMSTGPGNNGAGDAGDGASVICTELHRQGLVEDELYRGDSAYGLQLMEFDPNVMRGYQSFGIPIAQQMRKSKTLTLTMRLIAMPIIEELAYRGGTASTGNKVGRVVLSIAIPACRLIGYLPFKTPLSTPV